MTSAQGLELDSLLVVADFDGILNVRHDQAKSAIGLSVADMDFQAPKAVIDAVVKRAKQGAYGYTYVPEGYAQCVANWFQNRHDWRLSPDSLITTGRVVEAVPTLLRMLTNGGDPVAIPSPSYGPITSSVTANNRRLVSFPMRLKDEKYTVDGADLARALSIPTSSRPIIILTNPHNPTGRVFTREEQSEIAKIAEQAGALIVSDDVHADLLYPGHSYVPICTVSEYAAENTITFTSPGKTFNLAGLESCALVIQNETLREEMQRALRSAGFHNPPYFSVAASQAAYDTGAQWLDQLMQLVQGNLSMLRDQVRDRALEIEVFSPEGTYLVWLDMRRWGVAEDVLAEALDNAGIQLSMGGGFGEDYAGFARINLATSPANLRQALERLSQAHNTVRALANQ